MAEKIYLAHRTEDGRVQTIVDHLKGTAALSASFAEPFGAAGQAELAAMAHDIGKYSDAFQRRLMGSTQRVDHSTAGATVCYHLGQPYAAFAVAGHHGGLPDGGGQLDDANSSSFLGRIRRAERGKLEPCDRWQEELTLPQPPLPLFLADGKEAVFYTRMLYSCLVDGDYLNTEAFMEGQSREQACGVSLEELWTRFQRYISPWFPPKGVLNEQRCAILQRCIEEGMGQKSGLFSLTVPTGGGKTIASLAFALAHARAHGLRRVIYVIPYTSIIEQTAQVFREVLGSECVLEHHSNVLYELGQEADPHTMRLAKATENWDMPVVVTTAVQLFESLYACQSSQCRKLHNLAGSVVIFDEAQMLPIPYLRPCVYAIAQLVKHYRVSAVLCTATQPALGPIFQEFLPQVPVVELCPPGVYAGEVFRRVTFEKAGKLTWDGLAEQLNQLTQVLCIVNTRKGAQEVYRRLKGPGIFHLSTLMYPNHRRRQLEDIRQRLREGLPCRVVSTSLMEAGVDVDFPLVYREEAGLDSILQAAGRCNREGKRSPQESVVMIFQGEEKTPPLFATAIGAGRLVLNRYDDIASSESIAAYFHSLLQMKGRDAQDVHRILTVMEEELFPFRVVAQRFHLIDSPTRTVYLPLEEGEPLVERLRLGERSRSLFRQLGQYGVSLYETHFNQLNQSGDLDCLEDGTAILSNLSLYSQETGLSLQADTGKALFI